MPRRFFLRTTESDATGFTAGETKSLAIPRVITDYPAGDTIDPTSLDPHPTAFLVETFGKDYSNDYATWKAALTGRYDSRSVSDTKCSLDATRTFNGYSSLKVTGSSAANLFKALSPAKPKLWMRSFVWIDTAHASGHDIYLGAITSHNATFPHAGYGSQFPGDVVYAHDTWEVGLPGFVSYVYDEYDTNALGSKAFDDVKGFWLPIVQLAECAATSRLRLWLPGMSGTPLIDSTWSVADFSDVAFANAQLPFSSGVTGSQVNYGLVEFHDGVDPYGLLP